MKRWARQGYGKNKPSSFSYLDKHIHRAYAYLPSFFSRRERENFSSLSLTLSTRLRDSQSRSTNFRQYMLYVNIYTYIHDKNVNLVFSMKSSRRDKPAPWWNSFTNLFLDRRCARLIQIHVWYFPLTKNIFMIIFGHYLPMTLCAVTVLLTISTQCLAQGCKPEQMPHQ